MPNLIQNLEQYRLENKISQKELAKRLDVTFPTINQWLNGKTSPNKIHTYHIKKLLKYKIEYFNTNGYLIFHIN